MKILIIGINIAFVLVAIWYLLGIVTRGMGGNYGYTPTTTDWLSIIFVFVVVIASVIFSHLDHTKRALIWALLPLVLTFPFTFPIIIEATKQIGYSLHITKRPSGVHMRENYVNPEQQKTNEFWSLKNAKIEIGMERAVAEKLIADTLKTESKYNVYDGSTALGDQTVKYTDGAGTLEIIYNPGSAAPWVKNSNGVAEHYPPVDQTVKSFKYLPN